MESSPITPRAETGSDDDDSESGTGKSKTSRSRAIFSLGNGAVIGEKPASAPEEEKHSFIWERKEPEENSAEKALVDQVLEEKAEAVADELSGLETGTPEAAGATAEVTFLEVAQEHVESSDPVETAQESVNHAFVETKAAVNNTPEAEPDNQENDEVEAEPDEAPEVAPEAIEDTDEEDDPTAQQPTPAPVGGGSGSGGGTMPPSGPAPTGGPAQPGPNPNTHAYFQAQASNPNYYQAPPVSPNRNVHTPDYGPPGRGEVVGAALIGYLFGRWRGRRKAERQLKPQVTNLERQVNRLEDDITYKQESIRNLTQEKYRAAQEKNTQERMIERLRKLPQQNREATPLTVAEQTQPNILHEGPMVVRVTPGSIESLPFHKRSEALTHQELVTAAEKVTIDHIPLRQMYEANRFDEKGLRRIMDAFLRGGDVRKALQHELVLKESSFELDPRQRIQSNPSGASGGGTAAGGVAAGQGVAEVPAGLPASSTSLLPPGQRPQPDKATLESLKRKQMQAVGGGFALLILLIIVIILLIFR
jgi:hypothetical protein